MMWISGLFTKKPISRQKSQDKNSTCSRHKPSRQDKSTHLVENDHQKYQLGTHQFKKTTADSKIKQHTDKESAKFRSRLIKVTLTVFEKIQISLVLEEEFAEKTQKKVLKIFESSSANCSSKETPLHVSCHQD